MKKIKVCISQIVHHPALDRVYLGVCDVLRENGIDGPEQIIYKVAHNNISTSTQIARSFLDERPSVIVSISTPAAQTVKSVLKNQLIPHVFAAVTDPFSAGLLQDEQPVNYMSGVLDKPPLEEQLSFMKAIVTDLKVIGVIYNPAEVNSVATVKSLVSLAQKSKITVLEGPATNASEVVMVANRLLGKVDIIYVPQDNLVVSAMPTLATLAKRRQRPVPVVSADSGSVQNGALGTVGIDYYKIGRETGQRVLQYIEDEEALIETKVLRALESYVNITTEKETGIFVQDKLAPPVTVYY